MKEDEYTVTISTELNGRTVTQTVEKFPMGEADWTTEPVSNINIDESTAIIQYIYLSTVSTPPFTL